jgi:ubiquinone/menaquinone biosynthesis C-methylase UbiE
MAQNVSAERNLVHVQVIQADATATSLPENSFDLVHACLVLLHQREPTPLISEMVRLARPRGWVAFQALDAMSFICEPPHPAWTRLWDAVLVVGRELGIDVNVGRRTPVYQDLTGAQLVQY